MRLWTSIGPNPRVVTLFLAEKGITVETIQVDSMAGENRRPPYLAMNPAGGTPLLEHDGAYVAESVAICELIEELHPAPALIGATAAERAETRMWVRRIDFAYVQPAVDGFRWAEGLRLFEGRMRCLPDCAEGAKAIARDGLAFIDAQLGAGPFICGARLTLADLLLFSFVEFGAMVGQAPDAALGHVAAWRGRVADRLAPAV